MGLPYSILRPTRILGDGDLLPNRWPVHLSVRDLSETDIRPRSVIEIPPFLGRESRATV